jgi:hypothetical protein
MTAAVAAPHNQAVTRLAAAVQFNCDLADALHARDSALCTYLLGMREYYRWASGAPCGRPLAHGDVGRWITARESAWEDIAADGASYRRLPLGGAPEGIEPFDEAAANRALAALGLVYGAGLGRFGAPLFFLAQRDRAEHRDGVPVVIAGRELARGLAAPPALSRDGRVLVRTDALRRWLWTRVEGGRRQPADAALAALLAHHGGDGEDTVERIVRSETETLVLHELGEVQAAALLAGWETMLAGLADRHTEVVLRAVRDLLADCLVTLPALIERRAAGSLHFWYATLDPTRRALAPELASLHAAVQRGQYEPLAREAQRGRQHWAHVAHDLLARWRDGPASLRQAAQALMRDCPPA